MICPVCHRDAEYDEERGVVRIHFSHFEVWPQTGAWLCPMSGKPILAEEVSA